MPTLVQVYNLEEYGRAGCLRKWLCKKMGNAKGVALGYF